MLHPQPIVAPSVLPRLLLLLDAGGDAGSQAAIVSMVDDDDGDYDETSNTHHLKNQKERGKKTNGFDATREGRERTNSILKL